MATLTFNELNLIFQTRKFKAFRGNLIPQFSQTRLKFSGEQFSKYGINQLPMFKSYRSQSINLESKSIAWFLYDQKIYRGSVKYHTKLIN